MNFRIQLCAPLGVMFATIFMLTTLGVAQEKVVDSDNGQPEKAEIDVANLGTLLNHEVDIRLVDGTLQAFLTVARTTNAKELGTLKSIAVTQRGSNRKKTISASKIAKIYVDQEPLDVVYDKKKRHLIHSTEKRSERQAHQKEVAARLKAMGRRLWEPNTDKQQEKFLNDQYAFLKKVETEMSHITFRKVETEFFLIFTDMPPAAVDGWLVYLDAMYRQLCASFGLSAQRNIWCGKCVVIAFASEVDYLNFEATIMDNPNAKGSQGLCHSYSNGEVKFAGYRGEGDYFGSVLVHETTHGFVHRYLSSTRIPSWINEGCSDWIAHAVTKTKHVPSKQKHSAKTIAAAGGWGDFLTTERISFDHYGAASTMVDILLAADKGGQFRQYFILMKEGKDSEEALKEVFGISYQDLKIAYAQRIARMR